MTPLYLKLENFFSHKQSEIDFTQFNSALLIGNVEGDYDISNGSGKSAIFEGLLWCLFNKSRVAAMNDIIMWGESEAMVTLVFSHEQEIYRVRRLRSRVSSTSTVAFDLKDENGEWIDISGSTTKLTNDEIEAKIKFDYKTFVNSAYFRQNDISEFAESDPGKRKEILKSIIDISKWDQYEDSVKSNLRDIRSDVKILEALCKDYDQLNEEVVQYNDAYKEAVASTDRSMSEKKDVDAKIERLRKAYEEMKQDIDTAQWDRVSSAIESSRYNLIEKSKKISAQQEKVNESAKTLNSLNKRAKDFGEQLESIIILDNAEKLLEEISKEVTTYKAELSSSRDKLIELKNIHILEGECHVCGSSIDKDVYDKLAAEHEESVKQYNRKKIFAENKLKELASKSEVYEKSLREKRRKDSIVNSYNNTLIQIKISEEHLAKTSSEYVSEKAEYDNIHKSIETNERILHSLRNDDFNNIRKQIIELKDRKVFLESVISNSNMETGIYKEKLSTCMAKISEIEQLKVELNHKKDKIEVFSKLQKILGKNGIQTILLDAVIQDLENTCNKILGTICTDNFEIIIETQRVGSDGISLVDTLDLRVKKDGVAQHFKSLSGGEQFRVSLAIRIALSEISSRHGGSALEFLLLDEINSPLDRHGIETLFINVIKSLEDRYKIMVITHDDSLKERFDSIIDVTKSSGESSINFISR